MNEELRAATERLYDVFAGYPLRERTEPCAHCHTADEERRIHRAPLRELTFDDLERYITSALTLWGNLADFKHLLPRVLELYAHGWIDWPDVEIVYGHLAYGDLGSWPAHEQTAVREFAAAHLAAALASEDDRYGADGVLAGIMQFEDDISGYLDRWERSADPATRDSLTGFADHVARILAGKSRWNAFSDERQAQRAQFVAWLADPELLARLGEPLAEALHAIAGAPS